jgi:hypothetical protein
MAFVVCSRVAQFGALLLVGCVARAEQGKTMDAAVSPQGSHSPYSSEKGRTVLVVQEGLGKAVFFFPPANQAAENLLL